MILLLIIHADTPTQIAHKFEDSHLACYSYPNCDLAPLGCVIRMGKDKAYGHKD